MDTDSIEDVSQMEINISNINSESQIVLNDLRLLELLQLYPFLISKRVRPQQDADYDDWAWEQITRAFNLGYADHNLSSLFTVEELQWRWDILRPLMRTLLKAIGQIPESLWSKIERVCQMMDDTEPHFTKPLSSVQNYILGQISSVGKLSNSQFRRMEAEILHAILQEERHLRASISIGETHKQLVNREIAEFMKAIRVKELTVNALETPSAINNSNSVIDSSSSDTIINSPRTNLVISKVCSAHEQTKLKKKDYNAPSEASEKSVLTNIKAEPSDHFEKNTFQQQPDTNSLNDTQPPRYIPLKSAKYYVQNVKVNLMRTDFSKYKAQACLDKFSSRS